MKAIASLFISIMTSALIVEVSNMVFHGPWYTQTNAWPMLVLGATAGAVPTFLLIVLPLFAWLRRTGRELSVAPAFVMGVAIGAFVAMLPVLLRSSRFSPAVLVAASFGGGVGVTVYACLCPTPLTRRMLSGALTASGGTCVWALVSTLWQQRHQPQWDWPSILIAPFFVLLVYSWLVFPLGAVLGVLLPKLVDRLGRAASFACGSLLGVLCACTALVVNFVPSVLHTLNSNIDSQQFEFVQSSLLHSAMVFGATIIPVAALWVGIWGVLSGRRLSGSRAG